MNKAVTYALYCTQKHFPLSVLFARIAILFKDFFPYFSKALRICFGFIYLFVALFLFYKRSFTLS